MTGHRVRSAMRRVLHALVVAFVIVVMVMAVSSEYLDETTVSSIYLEGDITEYLGAAVGPGQASASCPDQNLPDQVGASLTCTLAGSRTIRVSATVTAVSASEVDYDLRQVDPAGQGPAVVPSSYRPSGTNT